MKKKTTKKTTSSKTGKIKKIGRVSSETIIKHTGKNWDYWMKTLTTAGANKWDHKQIVAYIKENYEFNWWWQQGITYAYEVHTDRRIDGQTLEGTYNVMVTKILNLPVEKVWKLLATTQGLNSIINSLDPFKLEKGAQFEISDGVYGEVRTFEKNKKIRFKLTNNEWKKPSIVQIHLFGNPKTCSIGIAQEKIPNIRIKHEMRDYWRSRIAEFCKLLK